MDYYNPYAYYNPVNNMMQNNMMQNNMMPNNNMMNNTAQRLQYMEQRYPQFAQNQTSNSVSCNSIPCTVVSCVDEAKSSQVALDGTLNVFVDTNKKNIYTKQINLNGTADFIKYIRSDENENCSEQSSTLPTDELITKTEFLESISELKLDIKEVSDKLKNFME